MRMFVAVNPPTEVVEDLADFTEPRRSVEGPLRWSSPAQWHITLAFMPSVADRYLDGLIDRLAATAAGRPSFELRLARAGSFPDPSRARLLWAGVDGDLAELAHLARNVRSAASRSGTQVEGGDFRPHLTLARVNRPLDLTRWLRIVETYSGPSWRVADIALYQSYLGRGPARHQLIETFPLSKG